jgi:hypothetical protein
MKQFTRADTNIPLAYIAVMHNSVYSTNLLLLARTWNVVCALSSATIQVMSSAQHATFVC